MEVISFDITGKLAHFRKFYSNNTALSFSIPPRTTIMGILAAICGMPKDSYYELFSSENLDIGIASLSKTKKTIHRLNFLRVLGPSDFKGRQGRIQTPFEVVSGHDIKNSSVQFRIFLHPREIRPEEFEKLKSIVILKGNKFPLTLGVANFNASISNYQDYKSNEFEPDGFVRFSSAINSENVQDIELITEDDNSISIVEEEQMPADFIANYNRELKKINRMLFSVSGSTIKAKLKSGNVAFQLINKGAEQIIQFMV